jgi:hypothetical protein
LQQKPIDRLFRQFIASPISFFGFHLMSLDRLWSLLPSLRTLATILLSSLVGAALAIAAAVWLQAHAKPALRPPPSDPRFVALGKDYLPRLGKVYAAAWEEGAKQLEAGSSISSALDGVSKSWSSNRTQLFDHVITPEFARIVAESVKDADVTAEERSALAAAWRGLSQGLAR